MANYRRVKIEGGIYFFTLVTHYRKPIFSVDKAANLFLEAINHVKNFHPFSTLAFCILPDHIHLLWEMPIDDVDYSMRISEIKKRFSKGFIEEFGNPNLPNTSQQRRGETGIWQRRFWEHYVRDEEDLNNHIDYIHYNPVKHGLVMRVNQWRGSSFFDFVKQGFYDVNWGQSEPKILDPHLFGE